MKTFNINISKLLFVGMACMLFIVPSCKKGDIGPEGPGGPPGEQGIQGVKGADGSSILSGTNVPAASLGKLGDYYFRTGTGDLYGPKVAAGWGTPTKLKGADGKNGTNGKNGSQFLSGTAIPAANLGSVGDFYFNTSQMILYGPKSAAGWGIGTNLKAEARVMYSGWQSAVRFKDSVMDNTTMHIAHIYSPHITPSVESSAVVLVYLDYGGGVFPLPYTSRPLGRMSTISYKLKAREIVITRVAYDGGAIIPLSSSIRYRFMIIPSNFYVGMTRRGVDFKDPLAVDQAIKEFQK
ncbi:hypothetical protein FXV77_02710 [Sphingobacterium phlebotomi]|uniref:Collagen-like protein n=1 Tax=Sphingobacterium phlebotomi TaxID=2605433 RepID=A0A5D4HH78_9SPHI|nr:hypothetical protein [Sphingobacterium phlebotomi]TYR38210.1 hypothetical protein FXV77_02710 [Sphingobacterium phlebotomi]